MILLATYHTFSQLLVVQEKLMVFIEMTPFLMHIGPVSNAKMDKAFQMILKIAIHVRILV